MSKVIIYKQDNGTVSVVVPNPDVVAEIGIEALAKKDVPTGKPFKIIEQTLLPATRADRDFWTIADNELTDGVGE